MWATYCMYLKVYPRLHIFLDEYDMEVMKITCESHVNHMGDYENHTWIIGDIKSQVNHMGIMKITCESHAGWWLSHVSIYESHVNNMGNYGNHMWVHVNHMGDYGNHMWITGGLGKSHVNHMVHDETHMWITWDHMWITREHMRITCEHMRITCETHVIFMCFFRKGS